MHDSPDNTKYLKYYRTEETIIQKELYNKRIQNKKGLNI